MNRSFVCVFIYLFIHSFIHFFIHSFIHSFIHANPLFLFSLGRTAFTHYLDINNPPRSNVLRELSIHASDADEAARLKSMGNGTDKEGYNDWVVDNARCPRCVAADRPPFLIVVV